jgi:hypothetical protein
MQLMDGNQVWRLPYLGEVGLGEPKKCDTPPRYEDWIYDVVNLPPDCFTSSYKAVPGAAATDPAVLDSFGVGKPGTAVAAARTTAPPSTASVSGTHNGVDQRALAACLTARSLNCLEQVPGLAECVAARLICNVDGAPSRVATAAEPMTADQAKQQAARAFRVLGGAPEPTVTTTSAATTRARTSVTGDRPVHVVASTARVASMAAANTNTYGGYVAIFDATDQSLLYACLGDDCRSRP